VISTSEQEDKRVPPEHVEKRGLMTDVVVPIAQSAVGGAVGAVVGSKLSGQKPPPPPPKKDD
jgi:hypothetical protein